MRRALSALLCFALLFFCVTASLASASDKDKRAWAIWRKSIAVGIDTPMRADLTLIQRVNGRNVASNAHVIEGAGGRYLVSFTAPASERGKAFASDGRVYRQYDPHTGKLSTVAFVSGIGQSGRRTDPLVADNYRIELLSDHASAAGRRAYLLQLTPIHAGLSRQLRWIDAATFKTLRRENRFADGVVARVVSYSNVRLPVKIEPNEFAIVTPPGSQTTALANQLGQPNDLPAQAAALRLPADAPLGFRLLEISSSEIGERSNRQMLYCDGVETISVFVQNGGLLPAAAPANWQPIASNGVTMFRQTTGHSSVLVWERAGRRYTAISRMPASSLQAFVDGLIR